MGAAIGLDGLVLPPDRFQGVATGEVDLRIVRHGGQHRVIGPQRGVIIAHRHRLIGVERFEGRIVRVGAQKDFRLLQSLGVFLPLVQRLDIIDAGEHEIRIEFQRAFQQEFGVVQNAQSQPQLGQQAHGFQMVRMLLQEGAAQLLGLHQPAFVHEAGDRDQLRRQGGEALELRFGARGRIALSGFTVEFGERLPAGAEARIALHRLFIGGEGRFCLAGLAPHMAFFLKGAAIAGAGVFQTVQRFLRRAGLFQVTPADGKDIKRLCVIGFAGKGCFRRLSGLFRPALLQQGLGLDHRAFGVIGGVGCHRRSNPRLRWKKACS